MLVEDIMITEVFYLKPNDSIKKAVELIKTNHIRHLPVIDDTKKCIGVVTDRDIRSAIPSKFAVGEHNEIFNKPVSTIMTKDVICAHPLDFIEDVAFLFYQHAIGCLPIERNNQLVGIITQTDVLKTFIELTGAHKPGSRIEIQIENNTSAISEILDVIKETNVAIQSILVYPNKINPNKNILVLRIDTIDPTKITSLLEKHNFPILSPKFPGLEK